MIIHFERLCSFSSISFPGPPYRGNQHRPVRGPDKLGLSRNKRDRILGFAPCDD
jgi:hypothetical protein